MSEDTIDLKEQNLRRGILQKFADNENKLPNENRKEQMVVGIEASRTILEKVLAKENTKEVKVKKEEQKIDSKELASEIKREVEEYER